MHHHALGADLDGATEVVGDDRGGPLVRRGRGGAEVDQVGRVDHHADALGRAEPPELGVLLRLPGRERPAARVAGEHLQRLRADRAGALERALHELGADLDVGADGVAEGAGHSRQI